MRNQLNARRFIQSGWCKGHDAKNAIGESVGSDSPSAITFCLAGAIGKAARLNGTDTYSIATEIKQLFGINI